VTQRTLPIAALLAPLLWAVSAGAADDNGITVSQPPVIAGTTSDLPAAPITQQNVPASSSGFLTLPPQTDAGPPPAEVPAPQNNPSGNARANLPASNALNLPDTTDSDTEAAEPSEPPTDAPTNAAVAAKLSEGAPVTPPTPEDAAPPPPADDTQPEPNTIVLQGLNKVTGHILRLEAPVGTVMRFGNLEIIGRRCWKSPQDEQPENAGLMEIWELKPGESHQRIFLGWIFSSSPGLSGLEHPVYDVTIVECLSLTNEQKAAAETPADSADKAADKAPEKAVVKSPEKAPAKKNSKPAAH